MSGRIDRSLDRIDDWLDRHFGRNHLVEASHLLLLVVFLAGCTSILTAWALVAWL